MMEFNQPLSGNDMPRFGGFASMMRLPTQADAEGLDVAFVGVPLDIGASNRSGARLGPRQIRDESRMIRPYNVATRAAPFESLQVADIGDVPINTFNLLKSIDIIEKFYSEKIVKHCAIPPYKFAVANARYTTSDFFAIDDQITFHWCFSIKISCKYKWHQLLSQRTFSQNTQASLADKIRFLHFNRPVSANFKWISQTVRIDTRHVMSHFKT